MKRIEYVCYTCKSRKSITNNLIKYEQEFKQIRRLHNRRVKQEGIVFTENSIFYKLHLELDKHNMRVYQIID